MSSQHYPNFLETAIPIFLQLLKEGAVEYGRKVCVYVHKYAVCTGRIVGVGVGTSDLIVTNVLTLQEIHSSLLTAMRR